MRRSMIELGSQRGPAMHTMEAATSVDCGREVRFRRTFRSLVECMVPTCCGFQFQQPTDSSPSPLSSTSDNHYSSSSSASSSSSGGSSSSNHHHHHHRHASRSSSSSSVRVRGTLFGYRKGRVSLCLQEDIKSKSSGPPLLLLEFGVPTSYLAKEMQYGQLRIALVECNQAQAQAQGSTSCLGVPLWSMYCNGRKVGFASSRQMTPSDVSILNLMQSVSVGAGVLPAGPPNSNSSSDHLMYLRASFDRVIGSPNSESFHLINPDGSCGQELSIFLLRS